MTSFIVTLLSQNYHNEVKRKNELDFVPNKYVASQVAEVILVSIYGDDILNQMPFNVTIESDSIWVVKGVRTPPELRGEATIKINKRTCEIIDVYHGK